VKISKPVEIIEQPTEKPIRDLIVCAVVGFVTGFGVGAPLSVGSYLGWKKLGINGKARWGAWSATGLFTVPILALVLSGIGNNPSIVQTAKRSPSQEKTRRSAPQRPNYSVQGKPSVDASVPTPKTTAGSDSKAFQGYLPEEDLELRSYLKRNPAVEAWMMFNPSVWIGRATQDELLKRGFFINNGYKYSGRGFHPPHETQGACTFMGFSVNGQNDVYACNKGQYDSKQWGIQADVHIQALDRMDRQWDAEQERFHSYKKRTDADAVAPSVVPSEKEKAASPEPSPNNPTPRKGNTEPILKPSPALGAKLKTTSEAPQPEALPEALQSPAPQIDEPSAPSGSEPAAPIEPKQ
jgi:hypothetical protein